MEYINKESSYRRVHFGLVASCKKGDLYGLLYGIRQIHWGGRFEKLKKEIEEEFDIINAKKITSLFKGNITDDFITLINDYNKSINETE